MSRFWEPNGANDQESASLGPLEAAVSARLERMSEDRISGRIFDKDHTVWKPDPTEITDRLGWLTVAGDMRSQVEDLESFAAEAAGDGFTHAVLLGMGGSSLAPEVLRRTYGPAPGALHLAVLDTTHPGRIRSMESGLDLARTLFVVASKSGSTIETLSQLEYFWSKLGDGRQFIAVTDGGSSLERLAEDRGFRRVFVNPGDIGGRYSALSYFGLVPAALIGADLDALLASAEERAEAIRSSEESSAARLGAVLGEAALHARDKMTLVLPDEIASFGVWVEQLIAESTGKEGKGIVPVDGEPLGDPKVYGEDRIFIELGASDGRRLAPRATGAPVVRLAGDKLGLGALFFEWEFATAVAGHVLGINPFDQPNVAEAKEATASILERGTPPDEEFGDLHALLATIRDGDYVSIQAYLDPSDENERVLRDARVAIRDRYGVATTVGFGPRFLHSTGQLHKGGPDTGVFIQVVDADRDVDVEIPGKPYTFGTLIDAQAAGDLRSLRARGRRVVRVSPYHLEEVR